MLTWTWIDDDTCVFYVDDCIEVGRCSDEEFDDTLNRLLSKYKLPSSTR